MPDSYEHAIIDTNTVHLHVVSAGDPHGQPVVLLHGFPEFWFGWRHQIPALASAGFRLIVPDQRGYNLSGKPRAVNAYRTQELAKDVIGLLDHFGLEKAALVGHDWGAAVAWGVAINYPQRVDRLGILNVPHPAVMWDFLHRSPKQMLMSWYIGFFQIPALPEGLLKLNHYAGMARLLASSGKSGTFSPADMAEYKKAWAQPGALTGMINWYRAVVRDHSAAEVGRRVPMPTLVLWGKRDVAISAEMAQRSIELCDQGQLKYFDNATHWVQHDEAEKVNRYLVEFLEK